MKRSNKISFLRNAFFISFFLLISVFQTTAQCFEIESLLVDACGSPEGENEMLRFKVGPSPLDANDLYMVWASSNNWLGICQNTASANATAALNNTITSCGLLIEPAGGILPANSTVLLITSTAVDANANSFANLNDTMYVIYQCAGNTGGHFGNYSPTFLLRTVTMSFSLPLGCYDQVTYNKSLLLNQNLQTGGSSALRNGATVNFDPAGNDTYDNNGCQAPITPIGISANNVSSLTICPGDSINLTSTITGAIQAIIWEGASGSFSNPNNATTTYYSSFNDITPYHIIIGGIDACNDTIYDSLLVNLNPPSNVSILEPDTTTICQGDSVMLHATGSSPFLWSTGETTDSILVNSAGNYTVSASGNCPSNIDTATIVNPPILNVTMNQPDTTTICQGSSITLTASGSPSYLWSTGATTSSITVNATGLITVTSNENCPSNTDSLQVLISTPPLLNITEPDVVELCQGQTTTLNVTNSDPFTWNTGATTNSITVNTADTFFVTSTNNCFTVFDTVIVTLTPQINVTITEPDAVICAGEILTLNANGANAYNWSNGSTGSSIVVNTTGNYSVTANSVCPSNTATVNIIVTPQVNITILEGNSIKICPNESITLNASPSNNYSWNTGATTSSIQINNIGSYFVETTNGNCPSGFDTIQVLAESVPIATILGDSSFCDDNELTLYAEGYGDFNWSNGDEGNTTKINTEGDIILTATNSCNETESEVKEIFKIDCSSTIYIPNSFTPNNDLLNDYFKVEGTNILSFDGKIFNRWGELLYQWNNISASWDGKFKGTAVPTGNYSYHIKVELINNTFETYTGKLLLLK